jgi:murein L,D-transpeptidase YafK
MKKIKALALSALLLPLLAGSAQAKLPGLNETVVVVDKKTHQLHLTNYNDGKLDIVKSFRATMGKTVGDKLMEGDLKTPEGIYDLLFRKRPPQLGKKFGPLALYVGYPNHMDKNGAKTGFDIMVHGTDDPARLERQYDSLGCVVLDNDNVEMVSDNIELNKTKIIITKDFSQLENNPRIARAKTFFSNWLKAWSAKDLSGYIESYADEYHSDGMNRLAFARYKDSLNKKYDTINVTATDVRYYFHEKYDLVQFTQHYSSTFAGGKPAFQGTSKKNLYLQERNGEYRIVMEESPK